MPDQYILSARQNSLIGFAAWSGVEKGLSFINVILVNSLVLRYLGPDGAGMLAASMLTYALLCVIYNLFADSTLAAQLIKGANPDKAISYIVGGRMLIGIILAGGVLISFSLGSHLFVKGFTPWELALVFLAQPFEAVISLARLQSDGKKIFYIRLASLLSALLIRLIFLWLHAPWHAFVVARAVELLVQGFFFFQCSFQKTNVTEKAKFYRDHMLLGPAFVASGIITIMYARADQFALSHFGSVAALGIYASVVALAENANILAMVIIPLLSKLHFEEQTPEEVAKVIQNITDVLVIGWLCVTAVSVVVGSVVIEIVWGDSFKGAALLFVLYVPTCLVGAYGVFRDQIYANENKKWSILWVSSIACLISFVSAWLLVPAHMEFGALMSTYVTYLFLLTLGSLGSFHNRLLLVKLAVSFNPFGLWHRRAAWWNFISNTSNEKRCA